MTAGSAIDARGVARSFGMQWVLRGVSLSVDAGEAVGLTGANGSGKSTLLRIVATLLRAHAGTVRVFGRDLAREADAVRETIAFLGHAPGLYEDLTARENLRFVAMMLGRETATIDPCLERVGLLHAANARVVDFSSGMQRRLAIGRVLLARPRLLLLDEPYSNLDASGVALLNEVIAEHTRAGGSALVVLHDLTPGARVIDRVVSLVDGRIAGAQASLDRAVPLELVANQR